MHADSVIANLVLQVNSVAQQKGVQEEDAVEALREPAFEDFLIKLNMGVALQAPQGHFFYVSQSLGRILGHPVELIYTKGSELLRQVTTSHDMPLVAQMMERCEEALKNKPYALLYPRISFDFHILSGSGALKRIYQHLLPNAVVHNMTYYSLLVLQDFSGFKTSPALNYHLSYLDKGEKFVTIDSGQALPHCPYPFTKGEYELLQMLAIGKGMEVIAQEKHISLETVKKHRSNILRKVGDKNMIAILKEGLQQGWLENKK